MKNFLSNAGNLFTFVAGCLFIAVGVTACGGQDGAKSPEGVVDMMNKAYGSEQEEKILDVVHQKDEKKFVSALYMMASIIGSRTGMSSMGNKKEKEKKSGEEFEEQWKELNKSYGLDHEKAQGKVSFGELLKIQQDDSTNMYDLALEKYGDMLSGVDRRSLFGDVMRLLNEHGDQSRNAFGKVPAVKKVERENGKAIITPEDQDKKLFVKEVGGRWFLDIVRMQEEGMKSGGNKPSNNGNGENK